MGGSAERPRGAFFERLRAGLARTRELLRAGGGGGELDEGLLRDLEERLILADAGAELAAEYARALRAAWKEGTLHDAAGLREALRRMIEETLAPRALPLRISPPYPFVILVVGVNGVGKTTTIGKIAHRLRVEGHPVLLAAADTFRAAAISQLRVWAERVGADVVAHKEGADSSAVAFDALRAAKARGAHAVLVDTAGRLHTKGNLMEELRKVVRVV